MNIEYNKQKLNNAVSDFYTSTGINLMIIKPDYTGFEGLEKFEPNDYCKAMQNTRFGNHLCLNSDRFLMEKCRQSRKSEFHICYAGLIDVAIPLIYDDDVIGFIMLGQMRKNDEFPLDDKTLRRLNLDPQKMKENFMKLPLFDEKKIKSIENLAVILAKYILFENMIKPDFNNGISRITDYISKNLEGDLSIQSIAKNTNFSKSSMYKSFHDKFGCTVSRYINIKRVEKAEELLKTTGLSIDIIATKTGFASTAYFSRTFKAINGISPSKFRKTQ